MHRSLASRPRRKTPALLAALFGATVVAMPVAAWEPTKPVEFVVPAGTGGGADQMARFIQGVITKNNLMKQPLIVVNKSGGAGAEGFLAVKEAKGDPNKLIITLSNVFTTPLATGVVQLAGPHARGDAGARPVRVLGQRGNALKDPRKTTSTRSSPVGRTNSRWAARLQAGRSDHHRRDRKAAGVKMILRPVQRGGDVAVQLVGKHVDSTVNNPIEAVAQWRAGSLRPLCVFDNSRMPYKAKVTDTMSWYDVPTCKEAGLAIEYVMLRGIFMPGGVSKDQVDFYVDLFKKVRETPDWKKFMEEGAFNQTFMTGPEYTKWVAKEETVHRDLMREAGFLAKP